MQPDRTVPVLCDLDAIQARVAAATGGPWEIEGNGLDRYIVAPSDDPEQDNFPIVMDMIDDNDARNYADLDFIAAARTDVPALATELYGIRERIAMYILKGRLSEGDGVYLFGVDRLAVREIVNAYMPDRIVPQHDPYEKCGPDCVAEAPLLDTADGREHDNCPPPAECDCHGGIPIASDAPLNRHHVTCSLRAVLR